MQYARETDPKLAQQRKEGRQKLFNIYPEIQVGIQLITRPKMEAYLTQITEAPAQYFKII